MDILLFFNSLNSSIFFVIIVKRYIDIIFIISITNRLIAKNNPIYFMLSKNIDPLKLELLPTNSIEFKIGSFIPDMR